MLICQVGDSNAEETKSNAYQNGSENNSNEYQTADDIFRIITRDEYNNRGDFPHEDLVLLYKNIDTDVDTHTSRQTSNQRVETIVHDDDQDTDSEISEINSAEDLHNVFMANKERIDLLNSSTEENRLCPKYSNTEIQSSLTDERHFVFRNPYIKQQLRNFTLECETPENTILPATLLDYICCKRLEDNYNFNMDNIIRYVQHTIEQLKRISNGDYLTDKAKEKWRNVDDTTEKAVNKNMKVLATSTRIPLRVERKTSGGASTWDDIVHSEVDIRSLSKILEKRIIIEIPKIISGSYNIFTENCASNLLISCKTQSLSQDDEIVESKLDVVLKLERSHSGQFMSNINSIIVLQTPKFPETPALTYNKHQDIAEISSKIIELDEVTYEDCEYHNDFQQDFENNDTANEDLSNTTHFQSDTNERSDSISIYGSLTSSVSDDSYNKPSTSAEYSSNCLVPDELMISMRKFEIETLPEEIGEEFPSDLNPKNKTTKKKSPTRIRIKSPYENKSYVLEEKKRKRLLEIREKRERRKIALGEVCKFNKQKYGKSAIMPQPSNSVTKLSITNKSFYNSIYGHAMALENNHKKGKSLKYSPNNSITNIPLDEEEEILMSSDRNKQKFINKSFYLDETETEMMYVDAKTKDDEEKGINSVQNSIGLSNFATYNTLNSDMSCSSIPDITEISNHITDNIKSLEKNINNAIIKVNVVPTNSPNNTHEHVVLSVKKSSPSLECRKSIDKIYELMPKLDKKQDCIKKIDDIRQNIASDSTFQESDSGTSLKHQFTSSNPSSFSFPKNDNDKDENTTVKKSEAVIPRVVISSKLELQKQNSEKPKKNKKVTINPVSKVTENPLKAISQLLHEIENIQVLNKDKTESKIKKQECLNGKNNFRQHNVKGRSEIDQHFKEPLQNVKEKKTKTSSPVTTSRRTRPLTEISKNDPQNPVEKISPITDKAKFENKFKTKFADIIDEARESRGEAVRGPSKFSSRLNTLAQPKKSYVQAHNEEYYNKYGRNLAGDRLQRLMLNKERTLSASSRNKTRSGNIEGILSISTKPPSVPPPDQNIRARRSTSCSPENKVLRQNNVPQNFHISSTSKVIKKMGDVQSYVNTHFRNDGKKVTVEQRSRVPHVPKDIDLDSLSSINSLEESSKLGSKLHHIIDKILGNPPPALSVLSEGLETSFMSKSDIISYQENTAMIDEKKSIGSDYPVGVLEDTNIVTAVENVEKKDISDAFYAIQSIDSVTEIDLMEKELYKQIFNGTFKKNLRLKKLTISPKHSLKQMVFLQSGGDGTLGVKSLLSQTLQMKSIEETTKFQIKSVLSKLQMDWDCYRLPMKVATVGYTYPVFKREQLSSSNLNILLTTKDQFETTQVDNVGLKPRQRSALHASKYHNADNGYHSRLLHFSDTDVCVKPVCDENLQDENTEYKLKETCEYVDGTRNTLSNTESLEISPDKNPDINDDKIKNSGISTNNTCKIETVVNTSSLDILVDLLNEIQKISECQTNMTKDHGKNKLKTYGPLTKSLDCNKCIDNDSALTKIINPRDTKSQSSIYTLYVNSLKEDPEYKDFSFKLGCRPILNNNDKCILVGLPRNNTISRFTESPSITRLSTDHGTDITESLLDILSKSSNQPLVPLNITKDIQTRFTEIQQIRNKNIKNKCMIKDKIILNTVNKNHGELLAENAMMEYDPLVKMKKDILVTVYSFLVFTVFAALSLPDVFNEY